MVARQLGAELFLRGKKMVDWVGVLRFGERRFYIAGG
jgi:hypothetical protein